MKIETQMVYRLDLKWMRMSNNLCQKGRDDHVLMLSRDINVIQVVIVLMPKQHASKVTATAGCVVTRLDGVVTRLDAVVTRLDAVKRIVNRRHADDHPRVTIVNTVAWNIVAHWILAFGLSIIPHWIVDLGIVLGIVATRIVARSILGWGIIARRIVAPGVSLVTIVAMFLIPTISQFIVQIGIVVVDLIVVIVGVHAVAPIDVPARLQRHGRLWVVSAARPGC
jgi:hypothetical protein